MSTIVYNPNPISYPLGVDPTEDTQEATLIAQEAEIQTKAPQVTTYSKTDVDTLLKGFYKAQTTATKAAAVTAATGTQKLLITVTADESQAGATKRYTYEGVTAGTLVGPF